MPGGIEEPGVPGFVPTLAARRVLPCTGAGLLPPEALRSALQKNNGIRAAETVGDAPWSRQAMKNA